MNLSRTLRYFTLVLLLGNPFALNNVFGFMPFQDETDTELKKVVLVVKLDSEKIQQLRASGQFIANIPPKLTNRVGAVRFKRELSFLKKPFKANVISDKLNRSLVVKVDNTILERLDFQPVEIKIYDSGFDRVFLKFDFRGNSAGALPEQVEIEKNPDDSPLVFIRLGEDRGVYGTLKGLNKFPVRAEFGDVEIPFKQVKGIRLNTDKNNSAFVMLHSGDEFMATVKPLNVTVNTWWGPREISMSEIESITISREQVFVESKDGKWQIQSTRATPQTQPNQIPAQPLPPAVPNQFNLPTNPRPPINSPTRF